MNDKHLFDSVATSIRKDHPSFQVKYKSESWFMSVLGVLVYPFNQRFMEGMTTTIGLTVYLPPRHIVSGNYANYARVLAHERVHVFDRERDGFMFFVKYLMPQILFLVPLLAFLAVGGWRATGALFGGLAFSYGILIALKMITESVRARLAGFYAFAGIAVLSFLAVAVSSTGWWSALAAASLLCLAPWPSPWRAAYEYRGYAMGIAISCWKYGTYSDDRIVRRSWTFTGPEYYRMSAREKVVLERLYQIRKSALDGSILKGSGSEPYSRTYEVYRGAGLVMTGASNA